jgi:hypothetical protein
MTNGQLQKHIRSISKKSDRVFITDHARLRMLQRKISDYQVLDCLRNGLIQRPSVIDKKTGDLKCRMEHFGSSKNTSVVVALSPVDPDVIVITVMYQSR